jgi:hypothetical protein
MLDSCWVGGDIGSPSPGVTGPRGHGAESVIGVALILINQTRWPLSSWHGDPLRAIRRTGGHGAGVSENSALSCQ